MNGDGKEVRVRWVPKYNIRSEGERVLYHDLIILTDFFGRDLFAFRMNKISFSPNNKESTAFRLVPFVAHEADISKSLKGGDIIQLFHKEESSLLSVKVGYKNLTAPYPELEELLGIYLNAKGDAMECTGWFIVASISVRTD